MTRDPKKDPRAGDVVQVHPSIRDAQTPAPLTVTAVDSRFVHWERSGQVVHKTNREFWSSDKSPRMTMVKEAEE